jgi:hypothetical protein
MSVLIEKITKPQIKSSVPTIFVENQIYDCKIIGNKIDLKIITSKADSKKQYTIASILVSYEGKPFEATILTDAKEYSEKISIDDVVKIGINVDGRYKNAFIIA